MVPRLIFKSGSGDMNTLGHDWGIPVVTYGPGDTKLSHTPDEVINYREIDKCAEIVRDSLIYLKNNVFKINYHQFWRPFFHECPDSLLKVIATVEHSHGN